MGTLSKIFTSLSAQKSIRGKGLPVTKIPKIKNHKLGISESELPLFFIFCDDLTERNTLDSDLELIRVEFNRKCELLTEQRKTIAGLYTIISLKSNSLEIQKYFLDIVYLMLLNLPVKLEMKVLKLEIAKLVNLFSKLTEPPRKTIQGLWSELLVIHEANNSDYLINSWHFNPSDKFDFNDGEDKIEVKSTLKNRRIHTFSFEQLNPNANSSLLIASVLMIQSGSGKNVFDLGEMIEKKINDKTLIFTLREKIAATLGSNFEKAQEVFYDFNFSVEKLSFLKLSDIPKIATDNIRPEISNIHFDSDLTNIPSVKRKFLTAPLHKAALYAIR